MIKAIVTFLLFVAINLLCIYYGVIEQTTFTQRRQDPQKTMEKYQAYWDDSTIEERDRPPQKYELGDVVGTITIPELEIYEIPIYYGDSNENKNWQLTTPGREDGWQLFGEYGMTAVGAHNYQLFSELPKMETGDRFLVETQDGIFVYVVQSETVFNHEKSQWIDTVYLGKEPYSTSLLTCYPTNVIDTKDRYIVYATMQRGIKFNEPDAQEGGKQSGENQQ